MFYPTKGTQETQTGFILCVLCLFVAHLKKHDYI